MVSSRGSLSKQMDNIAFSDDFSSLQSIFFAIYHLAAFFGGCKLIRLPDSRYSTFYNSFFFLLSLGKFIYDGNKITICSQHFSALLVIQFQHKVDYISTKKKMFAKRFFNYVTPYENTQPKCQHPIQALKFFTIFLCVCK